MATAELVDRQLDLYCHQAGAIRSGNESLASLEPVLNLALAALESIRGEAKRWIESVGRKLNSPSDQAIAHSAKYKEWLSASEELVPLVRSKREELDRADNFLDEYKRVALMSLDATKINASLDSLKQGRGMSHAAAMDELRTRLRP